MSDYDVTIIVSEEILSSFIQDTCTDDINRIRREYPDYRSLHIDIKSLRDYSKEGAMVVDKILHMPRDMMDTVIEALVLDKIIFEEEEKSRNIEVRYNHLPDKLPIREIRSDGINTLISVEGMVKQVTDVKPEVVIAMFQCSSCGHRVREPQEIGEMKFPPDTCPNCGGKRYEPIPHLHQYKDIQKLRVQESPEGLRAGEQPRTIEVKLEDGLVDSVTAGIRCTINGILCPISQGKKSLVHDLYIDCCSIEKERDTYSELEITPEDVDHIMEIAADPDLFAKIGQSIAPSVYGNEVVKEAITLMLFGGVRKVLPSGDILRGDSHILLVGDPGIAKSQLLRRLASISPRSAYVSGRGASAAGLTAAAVKEEFGGESRWVLEAGALVMADGGVACIDEDQIVVTNAGLKRIKDVYPGDKILNYSGSGIGEVKSVIYNGVRDIMRITTYTGATIDCTSDHRILTGDGWKEAGLITTCDRIKIPSYYGPIEVTDREQFERGFVHGFGVCDICLNEVSNRNRLSFSSSIKNLDRAEYILEIVKRYYTGTIHTTVREPTVREISGRDASFGEGRSYTFSSSDLKRELVRIFHNEEIPFDDTSYCIGFLAGIVSTDCCVSHKNGPHGVKHIIDFGLGRCKYDDDNLHKKYQIVLTICQKFGILAAIRGRKCIIQSLHSYNRIVEVIGPHVVGKNRDKLYPVEARSKISSHDTVLDNAYFDWFSSVKFNTSATVRLGLHSRIWRAIHNRRIVTTSLMETLKPHWNEISDEPFVEPDRDYILVPIKSIAPYRTTGVYDLTIEGEPNFLTPGGIVHNCVDEMDKMNKDDRSGLHEAMESQTISISKAGINATLQCRCALIGAANPKMGRFDDYVSLGEQIDMPPSLLSRFDLIFIMTDKPNVKTDYDIGRHILKLHRKGQMLNSGEVVLEESMTPYDTATLRKYIAYAKSHVFPIGDEQTDTLILDHYVRIRGLSGKDKPITIAPRQLEALVRLSEASARVRLSDHIKIEDVKRALTIFDTCMKQVAYDSETGTFDIDRVMTSTPKKTRDNVVALLDIVRKHADGLGYAAREQVTISLMATGKPIDEAEALIDKALQTTVIMEPRRGYLKVV